MRNSVPKVVCTVLFVVARVAWNALLIHSISDWKLLASELLSALLNWLKLVYGPFGQSNGNLHRKLDFYQEQQGWNQMYRS